MGSITTISVYNDTCDSIRKHPDDFAEVVFNACSMVYSQEIKSRRNQVYFGNNGIVIVQSPRHADSTTMFFHYGNNVIDIHSIKDKDDSYIDPAILFMEMELERLKRLKGLKK